MVFAGTIVNCWGINMRMIKILVIALYAVTISAGGAFAQTTGNSAQAAEIVVVASKIAELQVVQDLIEELKAEGFVYFEIRRTFLGRARIIAYSDTEIREIIINPSTSEVLRDLAQEISGQPNSNPNGLPEQANGRGNSGNNNSGNNGANNGNNGNGAGNSGNAGGGGGI